MATASANWVGLQITRVTRSDAARHLAVTSVTRLRVDHFAVTSVTRLRHLAVNRHSPSTRLLRAIAAAPYREPALYGRKLKRGVAAGRSA